MSLTAKHMANVELNLEQLVEDGTLNPESGYNEVVFAYWYRYDNFGQTIIDPKKLTPYQSIDRVWRRKFRGEKGDEEGVKEYVQAEKNNGCEIPNCTCKSGGYGVA